MRIIIYGAGGIGMNLGSKLHLKGLSVLLVGRKANAEKIQREGITLLTAEGELHARPSAVFGYKEIKPEKEDVIFLAVKSHQTCQALEEMKTVFPPHTPVFCLQNGVRNEEMVLKYFHRVYGCAIIIPGLYEKPGIVDAYAINPSGYLELGVYPQGVDSLTEEIARILRKSDFIALPNPNIMRAKWGKIFPNLLNAYIAITGEHPSKDIRKVVYQEAETVINAEGIEYDTSETLFRRMKEQVGGILPFRWQKGKDDYPGSTWQSMTRQKGDTEVEYFNGEIVKLGEKHRIPTPWNRLLLETTLEMAKNRELPGKYSIGELEKRLNLY